MTGRGTAVTGTLLDRILADPTGRTPYALLYRPERTGTGALDVLVGEVGIADRLAGIPLPEDTGGRGEPRHDVLAVVPYRQIGERGFAFPEDGTPLLALTVTDQQVVDLDGAMDAIGAIGDLPIELSGADFDIDDETYAGLVRSVVSDEIGHGEGANFVLRRSFTADITGYTPHRALAFFRRLLRGESGAYWTFIVHTGERTLVGASPERHVSLHRGAAVMNPISGTYRYPPSGPTLDGVMDFLADGKETDELYMVVDEELKLMARVCPDGGRVRGPYLKEMARLAHTEYFIEGRTDRDPREVLRETMFAPTVTGSPLESACRIIARYEPQGRGYYSGVAALIGRDEHGGRTLDSAILIRTADIDSGGTVRIGVGATLVRHSDPDSEVAETRAKAAGLLAALRPDGGEPLGADPRVRDALERRNEGIAGFWLADWPADHDGAAVTGDATGGAGTAGHAGTAGTGGTRGTRGTAETAGRTERGTDDRDPGLVGRRVLVVDAEDTFTSMISQQLRALGLSVTVRRFDEPYTFDGVDAVVMGPGPGDPRDTAHPKIAALRSAVGTLLGGPTPFLAVCLSHQVLATMLGLDLVRRDRPNQGVRRDIDLFGRRERVGFYNTFAANSAADTIECEHGPVQVSRDPATGEVHALRGPGFASLQFHAESLLTSDGVRILGTTMRKVWGL